MSIPIIKLEISAMKQTLLTALMGHAARMDSDLRQAVEDYCNEGNITQVIRETAKREIDEAVKVEVQNFFRYTGPGRQAIRLAVQEHMDRMFPAEPEEGKATA